MKAVRLTLLFIALLTSGCERDFEAPPPAVSIASFHPDHGFMGDAVVICGDNFDPDPENNIVYFKNTVAENLPEGIPGDADPDLEQACSSQALWVRIPELGEAEQVTLRVSTPAWQTVSKDTFLYDGPGHPVAESLKKKLEVRSGLWAVFTPTLSAAPAFGVLGIESGMVGVFEQVRGLHLDFGVCNLPLSAAAAIVDEMEFVVASTRVQLGKQDLDIESDMWTWRINVNDALQLVFEAPLARALPTIGDRALFEPNLVWSFPRTEQQQLWVEHDFVVTHLRRPAIAIVPAEDIDAAVAVELPNQPPYCSNDDNDRLGPVVDMAFDEEARQFYLALAGSNEIWRVSAEEPYENRRMWPPPIDDYTGTVDCSISISALAIRRTQANHNKLRVYVADAANLFVYEMKLANSASGEYLEPTLAAAGLDSLPYAMTTAAYPSVSESGQDIAGERLYVATSNGLSIIDVSDPTPLTPDVDFELVGEVPVPVNTGGVQALAVNNKYNVVTRKPDEVLFVDAGGERIIRLKCGEENIILGDTSTGSTVPQMASSYDCDRLYVGNSLSNTVHMVDRNSGLRTAQFPVAGKDNHHTLGFGSNWMNTLRFSDHDLLMLPLTEGDPLDRNRRFKFRAIAHGHTSDQAPACSLAVGGLEIDDSLDEQFEQMQVVSWEIEENKTVPVALLTSFFEKTGEKDNFQLYPGKVWCVKIEPEGGQAGILGERLSLCDVAAMQDLGPGVRAIKAANGAPLVVIAEDLTRDEGEKDLGISLLDLRAQSASNTLLEAELGGFMTDMLVSTRRSAEGVYYQVYLALGELGIVLIITYPPEGEPGKRVVATGGDPTFLSISPDGRRLYVSQFFSGQLSVIDTGCSPVGECESISSTIGVDPWPGQLVFDDSGAAGYVRHYTSSNISWVE